MLATLLMVHHMDGELPRGRAKLYDRYIDGMLGLWDSRWGVPSAVDLTPELKKRILTRLALHLHLTEKEQLGDNEIRQWFADTLPNLGCNCIRCGDESFAGANRTVGGAWNLELRA